MLIPVAHENLRGRRWPYVSIVLIVLNFVIFLFTHGRMQQEAGQMGEVRFHVLLLGARFPDAPMSPEAAQMVAMFKRQHPAAFSELAATRRAPLDAWDSQLQTRDWTEEDVATEMGSLSAQLDQLERDSITWNYAFHPYHPTGVSYITANFLHWGWLHIIFNMWFLWLAGTILEDAWGRIVYPIFFLISGAIALVVHSAVFPDSFIPVAGASGAIAGLMGGFLARFPTTRIRMFWYWGFPFWWRPLKFYARAYILLPLWLAIQVFWGVLAPSAGGVAYWAHIGGFAFGVVGAFILQGTGLEQAADRAIEAKVSWTADPHIVRATDFLEKNHLDAAIAELREHLEESPESLDAVELLLKVQEKKQDYEGQKETLATLCRIFVTLGEPQMALTYYDQYLNVGGEKLPRGVWLELCRYLERQQQWHRAASEFERFAEKNASERAAVPALVSAAQLYVKQLNRIDEAERLFRMADASPVPHLDQEKAIKEGLSECAKRAGVKSPYARQA
jgi:membrane associated rhomboid family serine protease